MVVYGRLLVLFDRLCLFVVFCDGLRSLFVLVTTITNCYIVKIGFSIDIPPIFLVCL